MGDGADTTTMTTNIPGIGGQEQSARDMLMQLSKEAEGEMGDLSGLAQGDFQLSPQQTAMLAKIQQLSAKGARGAITDNAAMQSSQLEDRMLSKGMGGATIEAVDEAMIGRQLQQSLDQSAIQGQVENQRQQYQGAFDSAGLKLNANQLLLNKLMGGAGAVANMGLQERMVQQEQVQETEDSFGWGDAFSTVGRVGAAVASGGGSEAIMGGVNAVGNLPGIRDIAGGV